MSNKNFQVTAIKRYLNKYEVPADSIDIEAEVDETLTLAENWYHILPEVKTLCSGDKLNEVLADKLTQEAIALEQGKANADYVNGITEANTEALKALAKTKTTKELDRIYAPMKAMIDMVAKEYSNALVIYSEGGLGKTYSVIRHLESEGLAYEMVVGYTTPLQFYRQLYENRDKLVVLDDVDGLMEDERGLSILKSALWSVTDERVVSYDSTTKYLEDIPGKFVFTGRIIFTMNHLPERNKSFSAMLSRCLYYEFKVSHDEKLRIMTEIAKQEYKGTTKEQRFAVLDYLTRNCTEATMNMNLRTLLHLFDAYRYDPDIFQAVANELLVVDEDFDIVVSLQKEAMSEKERVTKFSERTGKHRATYYRYKKKLAIRGVTA